MTQENKELLLKDLCARLPYGVKCVCGVDDATLIIEGINPNCNGASEVQVTYERSGINFDTKISSIKPYLFPLLSMTEEQLKEMQEIIGNPNEACISVNTSGLELWLNSIDTDPTIWLDTIFEVQDWLNRNHLDYRGLIEKGLAIDCTNLNIY